MAADYCCTYMNELDQLDDVNRWLPSEILGDIGIADTAERRRLAVVEDLAVRLAGVLSGASEIFPRRHSSCHGGLRVGDRDVLAGDARPRWAAPPSYWPAHPTAPGLQDWQVTGGLIRHIMVPHPAAATLPRVAPPPANPLRRGAGAQLPAARRSAGTGVFLPRTDAVRPRANNAARPPSKEQAAIRQQRHAQSHRRGDGAAVARRQQEVQATMAVAMEHQQMHGGAELALPQEWTY
ncbi:hypothetical protein GUJ93_ZPchr0003g17283 [Zizania palustris]|uniref:Uncharacterized protein n=1 Tax=Zizania palustris TaxID=103762 RepID=A0A8J5SWS4_ZIZPA|nr:hypothetical protein GUJ93_ZPchr0003g17283 [Zizania palustris]